MIQIVDNFGKDWSKIEILTTQDKRKNFLEKNSYYCLSDSKTIKELNITLKDYTSEAYPHNTFFSFFKDEEKRDAKNKDDLIISIKKDSEDNYLAQTGNYVGKFKWQGFEIDIKSRFSNIFLERMLNFANDIFLDDVSITGNKVDNFDISKYIIYYMFVQNLEKSFLLGLPKSYKSISHHEMKLKGKIDINRFIKHDIPFQGKVSSVSREQKEIQEVIDIVYKAVKIIEAKNKAFTKNISHIKTHLKQYKSSQYITHQIINKALTCKALQNPIFAPYKKVLEYAKYIINSNNIEEKNDGKAETYGFIINVAELFEIYITKLLQKEFPDWSVESPKIPLYNDMFYARKIIPDIVMRQGNNVMVFDTKYKKMTMQGKNQNGAGDVDRNDFFQINTYMSYYHNQGLHVKVGGLLYPMESYEKSRCHDEHWFVKSDTKFIIDGIELSQKENLTMDDITKSEKAFIERLCELIN